VEESLPMASMLVPESLRDQKINALSEKLGPCVTEEPFRLGIDQLDATLAVHDDHRIRRGLQKRFEPFVYLFEAVRARQTKSFRNQLNQQDCGENGGQRRNRFDSSAEPVVCMPDIPNLHHVRRSAGHDEGAEAGEHPVEGQVSPLPNEMDQSDRYRGVGCRNQPV
jgi:hypothetical protein